MKTLRRKARQGKQIIIPLLIPALFFLTMCPFAHSLTPSAQAPVLIPQQHAVEDGTHHKALSISLSCICPPPLSDDQCFDKIPFHSFSAPGGEAPPPLTCIATSRLTL